MKEVIMLRIFCLKNSACLSTEAILPLALERCGIGGEVRIERGQWGKPRLVSHDGVYFNLSHSGEYTVIALSDSELGCDIQQIKPVNLKLAKRYFHPEESGNIENCESKQELFFRYWCAKESFIKATGKGFSRPLGTFYIRLAIGEGTGYGDVFEEDGTSTPWRIVESGGIEGYRIAVCTQTPRPIAIERLSIR